MVTFRQMHERAVEWLDDAGLDGDQIRIPPPGHYIARNLQTGGESRGSAF
jgi:hypothetical protein